MRDTEPSSEEWAGVRRPGAGRTRAEEVDPELPVVLDAWVAPASGAEPDLPSRWTSESPRTPSGGLPERDTRFRVDRQVRAAMDDGPKVSEPSSALTPTPRASRSLIGRCGDRRTAGSAGAPSTASATTGFTRLPQKSSQRSRSRPRITANPERPASELNPLEVMRRRPRVEPPAGGKGRVRFRRLTDGLRVARHEHASRISQAGSPVHAPRIRGSTETPQIFPFLLLPVILRSIFGYILAPITSRRLPGAAPRSSPNGSGENTATRPDHHSPFRLAA